MCMSALVDVVMPVYNAAPYLKQSIESILDQTFADFQFIIIDDGSTDGSWEILESYAQEDERIILLRNQKNSGICLSLNTAIAKGRWTYIVRMDADDISYPDRIHRQVAFMEQHTDVGVCGCDMRCIDEKGNVLFAKRYPSIDKDIREKLFFFNPISHSWAIIRRDVFDKTPWYDDTYILAEDLELRFAIWTHAHFANIPQTLLDYRIYANNSTYSKFRKMITQAIKTRRHAIKKYGYTPSMLWLLAMCLSFVMQFVPPYLVHALFYKFRSLLS